MEIEEVAVDEAAEKDTWYCVQCQRRPYYEAVRLNAIFREAERSVEINWGDVEAGAGRLPSKMGNVSEETRALFVNAPRRTSTSRAEGAKHASLVLRIRPTHNQEIQTFAFSDNYLFEQDTNVSTISSDNENYSSNSTGEAAVLSSLYERALKMAPHLESE